MTRTLLAVSSRRVISGARTLVSTGSTEAVTKDEKKAVEAVETVPADELVKDIKLTCGWGVVHCDLCYRFSYMLYQGCLRTR